jgi:hypothetical protein
MARAIIKVAIARELVKILIDYPSPFIRSPPEPGKIMPFWTNTKPDHAVTPRGLLSTSWVRGPPARMSSPFTVATKRHSAEQHLALLWQQFLRFILSQSGSVPVTCGPKVRAPSSRTQLAHPARASSPRIRPAHPGILTLKMRSPCVGAGGKGRQSTCLDQRENRRYKITVIQTFKS